MALVGRAELKRLETSVMSQISVIDDTDIVLESMVLLIETMGHCALGFPSAEDFLASPASGTTIDHCVISDLRLSGMDAIELKSELNQRGSAVPFIIFSGAIDPDTESRAAAVGIAKILNKPITRETLESALASALDR